MKVRIEKAHLLSALKFQAKGDVRYYLNGIYINNNGELAATDGHRLFVGKHHGAEESAIVEIKGKPPARFEYAEIDTDSGIVFYLDDSEIKQAAGLCKVIDGRYPDYQRIVDKINPKMTDVVTFHGKYVESVFSIAKLFSGFSAVKIHLCGSDEAAKFDICGRAYAVIAPMRM